MNHFRNAFLAALFAATASGAAFAQGAAAGPAQLEMDRVVQVNGVEMACTGIAESQEDPRWNEFPVRVEFAGAYAQYLAGARVKLASAAGEPIADVRCSGAWVLLKLGAGKSYRIDVELLYEQAAPQSAAIVPPASGQQRFVVRFPEVGADRAGQSELHARTNPAPEGSE